MLEVGQRVKYRGPFDELIGALGIVMEVDSVLDKIVIRFDDPFPSGHDYGKRGATFTHDGPGFFRALSLEVIEDDPFITFTKEGQQFVGIRSSDGNVTASYYIKDDESVLLGDYSHRYLDGRALFFNFSRRNELLLLLKRLVNELEM